MARGISALPLLLALGCANPARMTPPPHLDFGQDHPDLAMDEPDLAVATDLAMPDEAMPDQATADLAEAPDLAEPDLAPPAGCDDAGTTGHLFLAAAGASNALVTSRFDEASGWSAYQVANLPSVNEVAETLVAARPLVVARQGDSTLAASFADSCTQDFPSLAAIGFNLKTALRPAALGTDVVFRGNSDTNLYYVYRPSTLWLGPVKQNAMTASSAFALVRFEGELEAYYSNGGNLSFGKIQSVVGGGPAAQILTLTTSQPPTAIVDKNGTLHVVFAGSNTNLFWIWRDANAAWDASHLHQLCDGQAGCLIDTNLPISLALDSAGVPVVAWVGKSPQKVFVSKLLSTAGPQFWDGASAASGSCSTEDCHTTAGPALATGVGSAALELVFLSNLDGRARHARLLPADMGFAWTEPVSIAGPNLVATPALIAEP